ncbi:type II toxin-antitoxin system HicB family antitoxin [Nostoc sp.]|uniref:type II toxin-antitoxin system HicB family antitoxin n=1 Tax=Nostoc sp. TaxID=1180 RepID=UPI002FF7C085
MSDCYSMVIQWSDEDNCYLVHLPEFPWQQFHTHGKSYEEAAKHGQEVIESRVLTLYPLAHKTSCKKCVAYF